jgi:hypothetical protein
LNLHNTDELPKFLLFMSSLLLLASLLSLASLQLLA